MKIIQPTISIGIDKEEDGTFTVKMLVTGLETFAQANAASEHMQRMLCGSEVILDGGVREDWTPPSTPGERKE